MEVQRCLSLFVIVITLAAADHPLDCSKDRMLIAIFSTYASQRTTCVIDGATRDSTFDFSASGNLSYFTAVEFSNGLLDALPAIVFEKFPNLELLDVTFHALRRLEPDTFKNASKLKEVDLTGNGLTTLLGHTFKGAESLEEIDLSHNDLVEISDEAFAGLRNLRTLTLNRNKLSRINSFLFSDLASLSKIYLHHNALSEVAPDAFVHNPEVHVIGMEDNHLTRLELRFASNMSALGASGNAIREVKLSSALPKSDRCSTALEIRIMHNAIDRISIDSLQVSSLRISDNRITELRNLTRIPCLRQLDVSENPIKLHKGSLDAEAAHLEILELREIKAEYLEKDVFLPLRKLKRLNLAENRFRTFEIENLTGLTEVEALDISNNRINELKLTKLRDVLPSLAVIYLGKNDWNCTYWKELQTDLKTSGVKYQNINSLYFLSNDVECKKIEEEAPIVGQPAPLSPFSHNSITQPANLDSISGVMTELVSEVKAVKWLVVIVAFLAISLIVVWVGLFYTAQKKLRATHLEEVQYNEMSNRMENPLIGV